MFDLVAILWGSMDSLFKIAIWMFFGYAIMDFFKSSKGWLGEKAVASALKKLDKENYLVLNDVLLKTDRGTSQIDHLVFSIYGIFVIETKNYQGWIYGQPKQATWTQNIYGKKTKFKNPLHQNYGHIQALKTCLADENLPCISIVVFSNKSKLKFKMDEQVIQLRDLISTILSYHNYCLSKLDIQRLFNRVNTLNLTSKEEKTKHVQDIKKKLNETSNTIKAGICPKCGGKLVERQGKYGKFTGCSNYPKCKYTKTR